MGFFACMFNSCRICAQVLCCSFFICMGFRACMFNSLGICARILYSNLLDYFLDERSTRDVREHTTEYNSIKKCFGDDFNLP